MWNFTEQRKRGFFPLLRSMTSRCYASEKSLNVYNVKWLIGLIASWSLAPFIYEKKVDRYCFEAYA